jgi:DNA-binding CsgD family transcriptional regulator
VPRSSRALAVPRRSPRRGRGCHRTRARATDTRRVRRSRGALAIYDELGDEQGAARTLDRLAISLTIAGEAERARPLFERSLALFRRQGDATGIALSLHGLVFARPDGEDRAAQPLIEESVSILRGLGDRRNLAKSLWSFAAVEASQGAAGAAATHLAESLTLFVEFGDRWFCALLLDFAMFFSSDPVKTARLLGAADAIWSELGVPRPAFYARRYEQVLAEGCLDSRFQAAYDEGARASLPALTELVLGSEPAPAADAPEGLTSREREVLGLIAGGLTDAEVADRLVVSIRTVQAHLCSIYRKLDVRTRGAATRYSNRA